MAPREVAGWGHMARDPKTAFHVCFGEEAGEQMSFSLYKAARCYQVPAFPLQIFAHRNQDVNKQLGEEWEQMGGGGRGAATQQTTECRS